MLFVIFFPVENGADIWTAAKWQRILHAHLEKKNNENANRIWLECFPYPTWTNSGRPGIIDFSPVALEDSEVYKNKNY